MTGTEHIKPESVKPKLEPDLPSSQSGPSVGASSSLAHTKSLIEPPEVKASQASKSDLQTVSKFHKRTDSRPHADDELHASRPSTPEEQFGLETEPDEPIEAFDWPELEMRYHDMVKERDTVEQQLLQDFDHLSQVRAFIPNSIFAANAKSSLLNGPTLGHRVRQKDRISGNYVIC